MTIGFDDVTATALNATTEVQLNTGVSLTVPDPANSLLEIVPYYSQLGAFTTNEAIMPLMRLQSDDIAIEPKRFSLYAISGGDATFSTIASPRLRTYALNVDTSISRSARINYFATDQLDATVEPAVGATVVYSDRSPSQPEQFYQKPIEAAPTVTGTALGERIAGDSITITGGREINYLSVQIGTEVALLSEHVFGFGGFESSDFLTSLPYRVAVQPLNAGLGANVNYSGDGISSYVMPVGDGIPIAGRTVINTFFTNVDALGTAAQFVNGVGYIK